MRELTVAVLQLPLARPEPADNIAAVSALVEEAAGKGAQVILPPELFAGEYFCREEEEALFDLAYPTLESPSVQAMRKLAAKLEVAIPTSFFERDGHHYYNTLAMVGPDGEIMGTYRKSHIPDGPGYEEKYYFRPGNDGFKVWDVFGARIGVGICWDQWYPECARVMALKGAEVLFYPTAIGSEPENPGLDTRDRWRRAMTGHAVSNVVPVAAANRIGDEDGQIFYGSSFIVDDGGDFIADMSREEEGFAAATVDLDHLDERRASWGFFRDRRPELYGRLTGQR